MNQKGGSQGVLGGATWVGGARLAVQMLGFISTLILARLLTPDDFGLVAISSSLMGFLAASTHFGINHALIRFQDANEDDYATAFTLNLMRGLTLSLLILGLAGPVAHFVAEPRILPVLVVVSVVPLLQSLGSVRFVDFEKHMQFRPVFTLMTTVKVITFAVTVSTAIIWRSYWALIIGNLVSAFTSVAISYFLAPYRPRLSLASWRRLLGFSGWLSGAEFIGALNTRLDYILLTRFLGSETVGVFYLAKEITTNSFGNIAAPLRRALMPALSRLQHDVSDLKRTYMMSVEGLFVVMAPAGVGIYLVAPDAVPLLLGSQWTQAIMPIQWLSLLLTVKLVGMTAQSVVFATGHTKMYFWRNLLCLPIRLPLLAIGSAFYGLEGAIAGFTIGSIFLTALNISMARKILGTGFRDHLLACRRALVSIGALWLSVLLVQAAVPMATEIHWHAVRLLSASAAGAVAYVSVHWWLWKRAGYPVGVESRLAGKLPFLGQRFG